MFSNKIITNPHNPSGNFWCVLLRDTNSPIEEAPKENKAVVRKKVKECSKGIPSYIEKKEDALRYLEAANKKAGDEWFVLAECLPL